MIKPCIDKSTGKVAYLEMTQAAFDKICFLAKAKQITVETPYGNLSVGDRYDPASGSDGYVIVKDVETYADVQDAVIRYYNFNGTYTGMELRMDWFKLMMVRYVKRETT